MPTPILTSYIGQPHRRIKAIDWQGRNEPKLHVLAVSWTILFALSMKHY